MEIKERELHKWAPAEDEANALNLLEGDLESSNGEAWDQFAANEKLFGLKTDFNEEIYTTHLNRSAPGYKDREKRALKLANEIQKVSVACDSVNGKTHYFLFKSLLLQMYICWKSEVL